MADVVYRVAGAAEQSAVAELFHRSEADLVVHNDLSADAGGGDFPADIYLPDGTRAAHCARRAELAPALERLLSELRPLPSS